MLKNNVMRPFYLVPNEKYEYICPDFMSDEKAEKQFVPMSSFWHIDLGRSMKERLLPTLKDSKPTDDQPLLA